MVLNQNQFKMSSTKGTKLFGHEDNVIEGQFHDASAVAVLSPGEFVCLDPATPAGKPPRFIKGVDAESAYFGCVLTNILTENFAVGEFVQIGILSCGVLVEAGEAINVGQPLAYDVATKKVVVATTGETVVGTALGKAAADGDLIKAFIRS